MAEINSLLESLKKDYPQLTFVPSNDFYWSPSDRTVYFKADNSLDNQRTLLHEVAHGLLSHTRYSRDIQLLKMEREAWSLAKHELASKYSVAIGEDTIEENLESYRDWLHVRSRCPQCHATGAQTATDTYRCLGCEQEWRVNDARRCGLRRYKLS